MPDGWFIWPSVEPAAGTAVDVSELNRRPAGANGRIRVADGQFVDAAGQRVRFWGCNLSAEVAFPPVEELPALARRLAKGGVNIARLHHLDNEWAVSRGGSLWPRNRRNHERVDPDQRDRLFRLVAALKAEGIYTNLNLKVSRSLVPADGFPESVRELPLFQKRVDIFDRRMIELQKAYARQLLEPVNPYTGLSLAADPAVAVIELNNENSLLGFWTRDLGRGLHQLPEPFRSDLQARWNRWLQTRYADDAALAAAWNAASSADGEQPAEVLPAQARWTKKEQPGTTLVVEPGSGTGTFNLRVTRTSGIPWHAQLQAAGLAIADGMFYTVSFQARADRPRAIEVGVGRDTTNHPDATWRSFGLLDTVEINEAWRPVTLAFAAHSVGGEPAALQINVGHATGTVAVRDLRFVRGGPGAGLQPGQSAAAGTVPLPIVATRPQWNDWIHFLAATERAYAVEMRRFLQEELGVEAPIVCSQIEYGGLTSLWREQAMEFADTHLYWQHPELEGGDFESPRWTIAHTPQLAVLSASRFGEIGERALLRIAGKPFAISEYDHPAPTEYACEMYPTLAAFAARQDWDAAYPFDIGVTGSRNPAGTIGRFFDQLNHPAKWGCGPFAALTFREGLIPPAAAQAVLHLPAMPWVPLPHADLYWRSLLPEDSLDFLNERYGISSDWSEAAAASPRIERFEAPGSARPVRLIDTERGRVLVIDGELVSCLSGYIGGATISAGAMQVSCERFGLDFATVAAVALDHRPLRASQRILVTVVGRAGNQDVRWNAERTSLGRNWGHGPPIVERVPARITLAGGADRVVYALAPDGTRARRAETTGEGDGFTFTIGPHDDTIHYEIVTP